MTVAVCPPSVSALTVCCGVDLRRPLACADERSRWTAAITLACCARNALPRSVVQRMSWLSRFSTSGNTTSVCTLGSQGCCFAASVSWVPLRVEFLLPPLLRFYNLKRISICDQPLREEPIGIKSDRRYQVGQLVRRKSLCLRRRHLRIWWGGVCAFAVRRALVRMNVIPASAGTASNLVELRSIAVSLFPRSSM
jgi:hypothetical protein